LRVNPRLDDDMLTPTEYPPPPTQWPTAHTAHSQHTYTHLQLLGVGASGDGETSGGAARVAVGEVEMLLTVTGTDFEASAELKCRLTPTGISADAVEVHGFFESEREVKCLLPASTPPVRGLTIYVVSVYVSV